MQTCKTKLIPFSYFLVGIFFIISLTGFIVGLGFFVFFKEQKEGLSFILRNMSISLDEHGGSKPGGVMVPALKVDG